MARQLKTVSLPRRDKDVLVVTVDPLAVARGPRVLPRGGAHCTAKRPTRARAKRRLARERVW